MYKFGNKIYLFRDEPQNELKPLDIPKPKRVNNKKIIAELKGQVSSTKNRNTRLIKQNKRLLNEIAAYRIAFKSHMKPNFIPKQLESCACELSQIRLNFVNRFYGIYFLVRCGEVIYVGQSVNILSRISQHSQDKDFDSVFFIECLQNDDLDKIERKWIDLLMPELNKDSKTKMYKRKIEKQIERKDYGEF